MLPGNVVGLDQPRQCERCEKPATVRLCTESDSFGDELTPMCDNCLKEYQSQPPLEGYCDWCKKTAVLSPMRDIDEGSHGPVYQVCQPCRNDYNAALDEEFDELDRRRAERESWTEDMGHIF
jgi:protein-arginine kinase activator protein McsA